MRHWLACLGVCGGRWAALSVVCGSVGVAAGCGAGPGAGPLTWRRICVPGNSDRRCRRLRPCRMTGVRDRWLGKIAVRQAELGARDASLSTLSDMRERPGPAGRHPFARRPTPGAGGGAAMADFDTLIELITSTIAPEVGTK